MYIGPIVLQLVLIFLNAVFASAEIAVISMNDARLKKLTAEGDVRAVRLSTLTEQPARFLATIQVAITLAGLLGSAFAADNFADPLVITLVALGVPVPENVLRALSVFLITLILAYFNLVFGELVPKRIAMKKSEAMAMAMSGMLNGVSKLFAPLVLLLTVSTNLVLKMLAINPEEEEDKVTEEEIRMLLLTGSEQGTIDSRESELIENVFEFDDTSIGQICTHRIDVTALYLTDEMAEWERTIHENRHTFYPVCGENGDDVIGVLDSKDYYRLADKSRESVLNHAVDKPFFVPENMKADVLMQQMRSRGIYYGVVLDEYGGMSGIITVHDLIEVLVGDLDDEEELTSRREDIEAVEEGVFRILGQASLEEVEDALHISLPTEEFDTFGGYIYSIIDRVPDDGEQFFCEKGGLRIEVHSVENHRIIETTVRLSPDSGEK